jgi:hypothetical protein
MKPWTWKQIAEKSVMAEDANAFVKRYGKLGALALEIANRMEHPIFDDTDDRKQSWKDFTCACGCAMCKQWHHGWSNKKVVNLYRRLYRKQYGVKTTP